MTIVLNHTIVPASDKVAAARFFADIFGILTVTAITKEAICRACHSAKPILHSALVSLADAQIAISGRIGVQKRTSKLGGRSHGRAAKHIYSTRYMKMAAPQPTLPGLRQPLSLLADDQP